LGGIFRGKKKEKPTTPKNKKLGASEREKSRV